MSPNFSFIIINYDSADYVSQCLESILLHEHSKSNWEIIILENGSPDQKSEVKKINQQIVHLLKKYPHYRKRLQLIVSSSNLGFGGGNNYAAQFAVGNQLFFLNGDTVFTEPILQKIENYLLEKSSSADSAYPLIIAPQILLENRQSQPFAFGRFPSLFRLLTQSEKKFWQNYQLPAPDSPAFSVDWVTGAAFVINKFAFEKIKGFDEDYFMYYEDIDLCARLAKTFGSGHIQVLPSAQLIHFGGKSLRLNRDRQKLYFAAQDFYFSKYFPRWQARLLDALRAPYELTRSN